MKMPENFDQIKEVDTDDFSNGDFDAYKGVDGVDNPEGYLNTPADVERVYGAFKAENDDVDDDDTEPPEPNDDPAAEFQAKLDSFNELEGNQFFDPAGIHVELKLLDQWLLAKDKRPQKIVGGKLFNADGTDHQNWLPFNVAVKLAVKHQCQLGFAFNCRDFSPACGIDIDHCLDEQGNLNPTAADLVAAFDGKAYIEVSTSGRGIHIIFFDTAAPPIGTKKIDKASAVAVEVYTINHFFVITGKNFSPIRAEHINAVGNTNLVLKRLADKLDRALKDADSCGDLESFLDSHRRPFEPGDDDDIIRAIRRSKTKDLFSKLFDRGDCSDFDGDQSRADFRLALMLAFFSRNNPSIIEAIFNRSKLADRSKWRDRADYRRRTIAKAIIYNNRLSPANFNPFNNEQFIADIRRQLERNITAPFKPIAKGTNFELVFDFDLNVRNLVAFNTFEQRIVLARRPFWHSGAEPPLHADGARFQTLANIPWQDSDDDALQNHIDRTYDLRGSEVYRRVLSEYAHRQSFHPVQDYFRALPPWDGIARAERLFIDHLGADDSEYTRAVTIHWLLAAVARVFHPGCKFDYCIVFKGKQGIGKSTILSLLGGKWAGELDSIIGKDAVENLQGKWIVELTEMQATKKAENEQIKAFISRQSDSVRLPYERRSKPFPRQCVFAATTNDAEVLRDQTGGRRFWFIECKAVDCKQRLSRDDVPQIWAEVYKRYGDQFADGFDERKLDLPEDAKLVATKLQDENTEGDDLRAQIIAFLNRPVPKRQFWRLLNRQERRNFFDSDMAILPLNRMSQNQREEFQKYARENEGKGECLTIKRYGLSKDAFDMFFGLEGHDDSNPHQPKRDRISPIEIYYELFDGDRAIKDNAFKAKILAILRKLDGWQYKQGAVDDKYYGRQRNSFIRIAEPE